VSAGHYENFPVASMFLPRRLRPAILAIYRFARAADPRYDDLAARTVTAAPASRKR